MKFKPKRLLKIVLIAAIIFLVVFWFYTNILIDSPIAPNNTPQTAAPLVEMQSPTPPALSSEIVDDKGVPMRLVPEGVFAMGKDGNGGSASHSVYLDSFYMDIYEVTNARYADCVTIGICEPPHYAKTDFREKYYGNPEYDNFPVMYVDWFMARTYCEAWRAARLPTEAEWEKAARGTDKRTYPWGDGISCEQANYDGDPEAFHFCVGDTSEVGSYKSRQSVYGLYDMAGNLFEWTSSLYKPYPYDATDGREDLTRRGDRVIRGGAWSEGPNDQQTFYRSWIGQDLSESAIGFRCASSP